MKKPYPKNRKPRELFNTLCAYCSRKLTLPMSRWRKSTTKQLFCSSKCHSSFQVGKKNKKFGKPKEKNANWRGGYYKECEICKGLFWIVPSRKSIARFCSKKCQGVTKRGKLNWNWVNGKTIKYYPNTFTKTLKKQIRKRDKYICQICGVPQRECIKTLPIHHIDYNKNNCEENNLITLCMSCHHKTNHNRNYWTEYFKKIMLVKIGGYRGE